MIRGLGATRTQFRGVKEAAPCHCVPTVSRYVAESGGIESELLRRSKQGIMTTDLGFLPDLLSAVKIVALDDLWMTHQSIGH